MRYPVRASLLLILTLAAAGSAFAQSASDFYVSLLRRGASFVEAGRPDAAVTPLRIAAFGLVESVEQYETSLAYLAVSQDRLGDSDGARESVRRIMAAERVERRFSALALPAGIRSAFETVAKKSLPAGEVHALVSGGALAGAPPRTPPTRSSGTVRPPESSAVESIQPKPPADVKQDTRQAPAPVAAQPKETKTPPAKTQTTPPPATATVKPAPAPAKPAATAPPVTKPPAQTKPAAVPSKPSLSAKEVASRLADADRALANAQLTEARRLYREVLESPAMTRESILRVAEGFYRARDFNGAAAAFRTLGPLKRGEEPYGYYNAVSLYETGSFAAAKKELANAIPFIEMTPDVVSYRTKIEGAH